MADGGAYADGGARMRENALFSQVYQNVDIVADYYGVYQSAQELGEKTETLSYYESRFAKENSNYFFTITDADGNVLLSNYTDAYQYSDATAYALHRNPQPRRETKTFSSEEAMSEYLESLYEQYGDRDVSASSGSIVNEQTGEETFELQVQYTVYDSETVTITGYVRSNLEAKDEIYYLDLSGRYHRRNGGRGIFADGGDRLHFDGRALLGAADSGASDELCFACEGGDGFQK